MFQVTAGAVSTATAADSLPKDHTTSYQRIALVIGNGDYKHTSVLKNPINDAVDIAAALEGVGFDVVIGKDLTRAGLEKSIRKFSKKLNNAKVALFFYAGHGLQVHGQNFIVPTDAKVETEDDIDFELIPFRKVLARMERKSLNKSRFSRCLPT